MLVGCWRSANHARRACDSASKYMDCTDMRRCIEKSRAASDWSECMTKHHVCLLGYLHHAPDLKTVR